mgnify:CR=1 FL=1
MRELLISVVSVSILSSIFLMIMPDGGLKKYVKLAISLVFIAFVFSSFKGVDLENTLKMPNYTVEDMTNGTYDMIVDKTKENIGNAVASEICEKFNINKEDLTVDITLSGEYSALEIQSLVVSVKGLSNSVKVTGIKNYLSDTFGKYASVRFEE